MGGETKYGTVEKESRLWGSRLHKYSVVKTLIPDLEPMPRSSRARKMRRGREIVHPFHCAQCERFYVTRPLNDTPSCRYGFDTESKKYLMTMDIGDTGDTGDKGSCASTGVRPHGEIVCLVKFCKVIEI